MPKFFFILGKNPLLSLTEIISVADQHGIGFQIVDLTSEVLIIQTKQSSLNEWQPKLGGTIKTGIIINDFTTTKELTEKLSIDYLLSNLFVQRHKKIIFGISLYGAKIRNQQKQFNALGLQIKKELKHKQYKSRFIAAKSGALTAVQIDKNKIIESGADIIVASGLHAVYLGKTTGVQEFEDYSRRDYGRPKRDAKSGMLPPKLAKILINVSQAKPDYQLLDPFCGSGTIIQEAILMGYKNIAGSDISSKAIHDTRKNIDWLNKTYRLPKTNVNLFIADVRELYKEILPATIDTIITEPYLGPPINKNISIINMLAIIQELESLYLAAFNTFAKIIKPSAKIVIIFPLFKTNQGIFSLKILEQLQKIGFYRLNPVPNKISLFARVGPTARGSLIYQRPDQKVQREIFLFHYKKAET